MTTFDEHRNLALGAVSAGSGVIGSTSGATLVAASDAEAAEFPAVPFFVTVWRDPTPQQPAVEIMRATAFDGARTFTVARAQQGTSAQAFITQGWKFANTITVADLVAIEDAVSGGEAGLAAETAARIAGDAATLSTAEGYADVHDATTLASAETYTDGQVSSEAAARTAGDAATLASAEAHSDAGDAVKVTGPGIAVDADLATFDGVTGKLIKDSGVKITTDGTLAANSDTLVPTEKAVKTAIANSGSLTALGWFDVRTYGAKLDGVTDDRAALTNAVAAAVAYIAANGCGATVYVGPGTLYLGSACASPPTNPSTGLPYSVSIGVGLPVNLAHTLRIATGGRGVTTFKLSTNARNVFWISQSADYDTFQNIQVDDCTVDNNNTAGRCHILIGSMPADLTSQRRLNYQDIKIGDIDILNVPVDATQATSAKNGILFLGSHPAALEGTQTHSKRITIGNVRQWGGDGAVLVTSWGAGTLVGGTNHYYDQIIVGDVLHDNSATGVPAATIAQTSVYICGTGFGDYFKLGHVTSIDIGDDAVEIGAMQAGEIASINATNPFLVALLFRNSHALQNITSQKITVGTLTVKNDAGAGAVAGFIGRPVAWIEDSSSSDFGEFDIDHSSYWADGLTYANQNTPDIAFVFSTNVRKRVFGKIQIALTNYAAASGSGTVDASVFNVNTTSGEVVVDDINIVASVAASAGAGLAFNFYGIKHQGSANILTVNGYTVDFTGTAYTNSTGGSVYAHAVAKGGGATIRGVLRRFYPGGTLPSGVGTRAISFQNGGAITGYLVADSDITGWSGISAGRDIEMSTAATNAAKVVVRDVIGKDGVRLGPNGRRATAADYTILACDAATLAVTSTAAPRAITLPAANAVPVGQVITVTDESNAAGTNNITVSRAGADTFLGGGTSVVISTNGGKQAVYSTGSVWIPV